MIGVDEFRRGFRRQRRALDVTGEVVAGFLQVCPATVSNFEHGKANLSVTKQIQLLQLLYCIEHLQAARGSAVRLRDGETARRVVTAILNRAAPETLKQIISGTGV